MRRGGRQPSDEETKHDPCHSARPAVILSEAKNQVPTYDLILRFAQNDKKAAENVEKRPDSEGMK